MLFNEVILLETLCFDLTVEHPHSYLQHMETKLDGKAVTKVLLTKGRSQKEPLTLCFPVTIVSGSMLRKAWMLLYQW